MSLDKSLKTTAALTRHRNVLSRHERIVILMDEDRWPEGRAPIALPKVAHRKVNVGGKDKRAKTAKTNEPAAVEKVEKKPT